MLNYLQNNEQTRMPPWHKSTEKNYYS